MKLEPGFIVAEPLGAAPGAGQQRSQQQPGAVAKAQVQPNAVVLLALKLDEHLRHLGRVANIAIQEFVG